MLRLTGNLLIFWAAAAGLASIAMHIRVRAWHSEVGRHLMVYTGAVTAVLLLTCIRIVFGDSWWFQWLRLLVFVAVPIAMTQRLLIQIRASRVDRRNNPKVRS